MTFICYKCQGRETPEPEKREIFSECSCGMVGWGLKQETKQGELKL